MERQSARVQAAGAYGADTSPGGCAVLYVSGNTDVCVCVCECRVGDIHTKGTQRTSSKPNLFLSCPKTQTQNLDLGIKDF